MTFVSDCGAAPLLENGQKTILKNITLDLGLLEREVSYSCDDGFFLYPNLPARTCQASAEWSSDDELSCIGRKYNYLVVL